MIENKINNEIKLNNSHSIKVNNNYSYNDIIKYFSENEKILILNTTKDEIEITFDKGMYADFSIYLGSNKIIYGLENKNISKIYCGDFCDFTVGNNINIEIGNYNNIYFGDFCYIEFGKSNNLEGKNNNILKFNKKILKNLNFNDIEDIKYSNIIKVGYNNIIYGYYIKNITINDFNILIENINTDETLKTSIKIGGENNIIILNDEPNFIITEEKYKKQNKTKQYLNNLMESIGGKNNNKIIYNGDSQIDYNKIYIDKKTIEKIKLTLKNKVLGQDQIINNVISFLKGINIKTKKGPRGVFFQIGKTGVGKNFLWEIISKESGIKLKTIDASTFHVTEGTSLLGAGQGFIGSDNPSIFENIYYESLENNGKIILLIDEIDKINGGNKKDKKEAINNFLTSLMNIFENDKVLLKNIGKEIDISNFIIVLNTNLFLDNFEENTKRKIGFYINEGEKNNELGYNKEEILGKIKGFLNLSLYNRISSNILLYNNINDDIINNIINNEFNILLDSFKKYYSKDKEILEKLKNINIDQYYDKIIKNYDSDLGIRGIKNYIHNHIKNDILLLID